VQHLDPDRLVLLALAESTTDEAEAVHLAGCAECQTELDALKHVADLGAETQGLADLPRPPDRVWAGIAAATSQNQKHFPVRAHAPANRKRPRWLAPVLSAAAAAILAVAGTVAVIRLADTSPSVTAKAALAPLPAAPSNARGDARVLANGELGIDVSHLPLTTGYYEVWLIDPENTTKMVSIGNLPDRSDGPDVVLPIPPGTDLNTYRLVDVSAEAHDGNSAHSGKSLLRGTLTN
jgi:hypothetical protein